MSDVGIGTGLGFSSGGSYGVPYVAGAVAASDTSVRITYDQPMKAENPSAADDALNPSNYVFTVTGGIDVTAVSVSKVGVTSFEIDLSSEMTGGVYYRVTVNNVRSTYNEALNPLANSKEFVGSGTKPRVSDAVAADAISVQVDFNEAMRNNAALTDPSNYVIGGYGSITVTGVTRDSDTRVTLLVNATMKTGEAYTVTVSSVQDVAWNVIDPAYNSKSFTGVGSHPKLLTPANTFELNTVIIEFDQDVVGNEAMDAENYYIEDEGHVPLELWKWWALNTTEGLKCKAAVENEYDPASGPVTLVAAVTLDDNASHTVFDKLDVTNNGYWLGTTGEGKLRATFGNGSLTTVTEDSHPVAIEEKILLVLRYDGTNLEVVHVSAGAVYDNAGVAPTPGNSSKYFHALIRGDLSQGIAGKVHWFGYFKSVLSRTDLQDLHSGTKNPKEFSPFVYVDFHKDVATSYKPEVAPTESLDWNFEVLGTPTKVGVVQVTGKDYRVATEDHVVGKTYTLFVLAPGTPYPSGIHDFYGNECKAPDNKTTFVGTGITPPNITIHPPDDTRNVALRTPLRVHMADDTYDFTGIDESSPWVEVLYTENDVSYSLYFVEGGDVQVHASGTKTGSGDSEDGLWYELLPRLGKWNPETTYTVHAYALDNGGSANLVSQTFRTDSLARACFEDKSPVATTLDSKILSPLSGPNIEKIRSILLKACTKSNNGIVQARTLLHVACITELRSILAEFVDYDTVDSIKLCDRQPLLNIRRALLPYWAHVKPALQEINGLSLPARRMLERYTDSQSAIYAVNAVAAAIVLAAYYESTA